MMPSFPLWDRENHSSQAPFFMIVHSRLHERCNRRELSGCLFFQRQRIFPVFSIELLVLSCEITCAIRLPWKKSFKAAGSTGQSPARHVSPRENTRPIEAAKVPLPRWVSVSLAKRLRHLCSTRSSRRNIFRKSSASRHDF